MHADLGKDLINCEALPESGLPEPCRVSCYCYMMLGGPIDAISIAHGRNYTCGMWTVLCWELPAFSRLLTGKPACGC